MDSSPSIVFSLADVIYILHAVRVQSNYENSIQKFQRTYSTFNDLRLLRRKLNENERQKFHRISKF